MRPWCHVDRYQMAVRANRRVLQLLWAQRSQSKLVTQSITLASTQTVPLSSPSWSRVLLASHSGTLRSGKRLIINPFHMRGATVALGHDWFAA